MMSGGALDPFRMVASPELLAAADNAVALAGQMSSNRESDLASKGQHPTSTLGRMVVGIDRGELRQGMPLAVKCAS